MIIGPFEHSVQCNLIDQQHLLVFPCFPPSACVSAFWYMAYESYQLYTPGGFRWSCAHLIIWSGALWMINSFCLNFLAFHLPCVFLPASSASKYVCANRKSSRLHPPRLHISLIRQNRTKHTIYWRDQFQEEHNCNLLCFTPRWWCTHVHSITNILPLDFVWTPV